MELFARMGDLGYGAVHVRSDASAGLRAIVAVHDARLGPALGGCRFIAYANEDAAFTDALRLARGMTYKAALAGLPHGGGKSVLLRPAGMFDRDALFRAFGRFLRDLDGQYITAEDSGTSEADMRTIRTETRWVSGLAKSEGGGGDPSPYTALGVRRGIEACVRYRLEKHSLADVHVAVQGVGSVGMHLCRELHALGARLTVTDQDATRSERARTAFGATVVAPDAILDVQADVFAPCALGAVIDDASLARLRVAIIAGAANNQLAETRHGEALVARGITYAPDYAINAGGLINVAQEVAGYDEDVVRTRTLRIHDTILAIVARADRERVPSARIADTMVDEILATKPAR